MDADALAAAWLAAKRGRSDSAKTETAYRSVLSSFRAHLAAAGLQLDSSAPLVAAAAAVYAASGRRPVSAATFNQRLAVLSSFYAFGHRRQLLTVPNPIALVERRPLQTYAAARALDYAAVRASLAAIDRTEPAGARDYALLAVLLQTGRRAAEVASLQTSDLAPQPDGTLVVAFRRCKGGKSMSDHLTAAVSSAVTAWLRKREGILQANISGDTHSLWISLAGNGTAGGALHHGAIAAICQRRLGTSRVHATRHTFARAMEDAGAKISDIQARLGHASLATTGRYLAALKRAENAHGSAVSDLLGLE